MTRISVPLKRQMRREHVAELHEALGALGYEVDEDESAKQRFGATTRKAVQDFRTVHRVSASARRLALTAGGIAVGAAAAVLVVFAARLTPVALATAGLGLASGAAIPGAEWLLDWRDGKKSVQENGLHYLLNI